MNCHDDAPESFRKKIFDEEREWEERERKERERKRKRSRRDSFELSSSTRHNCCRLTPAVAVVVAAASVILLGGSRGSRFTNRVCGKAGIVTILKWCHANN